MIKLYMADLQFFSQCFYKHLTLLQNIYLFLRTVVFLNFLETQDGYLPRPLLMDIWGFLFFFAGCRGRVLFPRITKSAVSDGYSYTLYF